MPIPADDSAYRQVRHQLNSWTYNHDAGQWVPNRQGFQFDSTTSELGAEEMSVFLESGLAAADTSVADVANRGGLTEVGAVFEFPQVASLPDRVEHCSGVAATPMPQPETIGPAHASIYREKLNRPAKDMLHGQLIAESTLCSDYPRPEWDPPPG